MTEFKCSLCDYTSYIKANMIKHINKKIKCNNGIPNFVEINISIQCENCENNFSTKQNLTRHLKTCKFKKSNLEEENKKLKETIEKLHMCVNTINTDYSILLKKCAKLEESVNSVPTLIDCKVLGNTDISTIRTQSRNKYRKIFSNMECVHCGHNGSTQVCHIKAISEFNKLSTIKEINHISNLIGLCPNCHIDLDKHKKFEVLRTATLHNMIMKKIKN